MRSRSQGARKGGATEGVAHDIKRHDDWNEYIIDLISLQSSGAGCNPMENLERSC